MKRPIEESDVYALSTSFESKVISNKFSKLWDDELQRQKPSMIRLFLRYCGCPVFFVGQLYANTETIAK